MALRTIGGWRHYVFWLSIRASLHYTSLCVISWTSWRNSTNFTHSLPDKLISFCRSWGQRSTLHGADFDLSYNKFLYAISPEPAKGILKNLNKNIIPDICELIVFGGQRGLRSRSHKVAYWVIYKNLVCVISSKGFDVSSPNLTW